MKAVTRRVFDMCGRVLSWTIAHPDDERGFAVLAARLEAVAGRIARLIRAQRDGLIDVRAASARKQELRREMLAVPIAHLAGIGAMAREAQHELRMAFRFKVAAHSFAAFHSAARSMYATARSHQEVLVEHGMSESVLAEFGRMLDEFDAAVRLGSEGRTAHTAATRELLALTREVGRIVRAMDARNRVRFRNERGALEQWIAARTVLGVRRGAGSVEETRTHALMLGMGGAPGKGDVTPAA